ncbi:MAG: electron transfer flavoprotein subunit alpha/FixB family protein [Deltaproteobacteria bacterium]|nr:electron transfer flavoprotein subunit alpha/FixB family protein [Deltaproteobacteria bacterium]
MGDVYVVAEHLNGELAEMTFEMLVHARGLAGGVGGSVTAVLIGGTDAMAAKLGAADKVIRVAAEADYNPDTYAAGLKAVVDAKKPQVVMAGNTSQGMDLANALSARNNMPMAAACLKVSAAGGNVHAVSQLYGGKMNVTSNLGSGPCVVTVAAGAVSADGGRKDGAPASEDGGKAPAATKLRFKKLIQPEKGDVDITTQDVLVAVGRGIGKKEDIEVAVELADKLKAAVAASRPIIDAGWMPKSRQVGKSGLKVKPKVYLALGISGAPEHLEGMKNSATIIAVNTDKNAPIFDVAHYGLVGDLFDVVEEMMDEL